MVLLAAGEQSHMLNTVPWTDGGWTAGTYKFFWSASPLYLAVMLTNTAAALHMHAPVIERSGPVPVFSRIMSLVDD